jgi:hypothetical protein
MKGMKEKTMGAVPVFTKKYVFLFAMVSVWILSSLPVFAVDSKETQYTLTGLKGVKIVVEEMQPGMRKYEKAVNKVGLNREQVQRDIEQRLQYAGIRVLTPEVWTNTPGRPVLYVNINTHENEKYWLAYDIRIDLHQLVSMESNPKIKTLASTWSMNVTGIANIGTLNVIRSNIVYLVDRFIQAYKSVNSK